MKPNMCSSACMTPRRMPSFTGSRFFSGVLPTADAVIWCSGTVALLCCVPPPQPPTTTFISGVSTTEQHSRKGEANSEFEKPQQGRSSAVTRAVFSRENTSSDGLTVWIPNTRFHQEHFPRCRAQRGFIPIRRPTTQPGLRDTAPPLEQRSRRRKQCADAAREKSSECTTPPLFESKKEHEFVSHPRVREPADVDVPRQRNDGAVRLGHLPVAQEGRHGLLLPARSSNRARPTTTTAVETEQQHREKKNVATREIPARKHDPRPFEEKRQRRDAVSAWRTKNKDREKGSCRGRRFKRQQQDFCTIHSCRARAGQVLPCRGWPIPLQKVSQRQDTLLHPTSPRTPADKSLERNTVLPEPQKLL